VFFSLLLPSIPQTIPNLKITVRRLVSKPPLKASRAMGEVCYNSGIRKLAGLVLDSQAMKSFRALLFTTEAQRAQRDYIFARSGDGDRAKELSPVGIVLAQTTLILAREIYLYPEYSGEAGGFFSLAAFSRPGKKPLPLWPLCLCGNIALSLDRPSGCFAGKMQHVSVPSISG
jgi:hypothetical protein